MDDIDRLADLFEAGPAAVLTGAGISTDSGIPDYRGAGSPPRTPMRIDQFMHDLAYRRRFWAGARVGALVHSPAKPNAGHLALARLEAAGSITGVITQNVDGLHQLAGSRTVVELHGSGGSIRCVDCGSTFSRAEVLEDFDALNSGYVEHNARARIAPDGDAAVAGTEEVIVPSCRNCGGILRPDVVYFGETVPRPVFADAEKLVSSASSLIIAGSSLAVNTGVRLLHRATRSELPVAVINRGPTAADRSALVRIDGGTSETLTGLLAALSPADTR